MANVTTSKETNVIEKSKVGKVREMDFAIQFGENVNSLIEMLGVTRTIPAQAGTALKKVTVTGTLSSASVGEGEIIPLSQYETTYTTVAELTLKKYRKATTAEAIQKSGFEDAVLATDKKMVLDIQKSIRDGLISSLDDDDATEVSGETLQAVLAQAWGQIQTKFEDDGVSTVFFINPLDVAEYLASANITIQDAFGFTYVQNFMGIGTAVFSGAVTQGTVYATASENIVAYYIDVTGANGFGDAFDFTADPETGFVGVHEESNYTRMQNETVAVCGVTFFAEVPAGVVVGTIGDVSA